MEEGLVEEVVRLLLPDPQTSLIEGVHQLLDVLNGEAAAEVAGGGRIGDALGPEGVEVDLVVTPDLEVLQATDAGQEVVGDIQDVIALVIGQVPLQQVEVLVDALDQPGLAGQEVDGPDAAGCDAPDPLGDLVVDIGGSHHRLGAFDPGLVLQSAEDSPLASVQPAVDSGVPSKTSWGRRVEGRESPRLFAKTRGFSRLWASKSLGLRLVED
ncbi:MAG TPA: hypothetical protein VKP69_11265 [Isosphaeraceae bacterium]|nr:hypothetical protein [Isosphaeraceae bacterium]